MNEKEKYDPEDLEALLAQKGFEDLYTEEREFVLRHLDSDKEYEAMRRTLFNVKESVKDESNILPPPRIKKALMAEFEQKHKRGFVIWLNGIAVLLATKLLPPQQPRYRQPAFQLAFACVLAMLVFVALPGEENFNPSQTVALHDVVADPNYANATEEAEGDADLRAQSLDYSLLKEDEKIEDVEVLAPVVEKPNNTPAMAYEYQAQAHTPAQNPAPSTIEAPVDVAPTADVVSTSGAELNGTDAITSGELTGGTFSQLSSSGDGIAITTDQPNDGGDFDTRNDLADDAIQVEPYEEPVSLDEVAVEAKFDEEEDRYFAAKESAGKRKQEELERLQLEEQEVAAARLAENEVAGGIDGNTAIVVDPGFLDNKDGIEQGLLGKEETISEPSTALYTAPAGVAEFEPAFGSTITVAPDSTVAHFDALTIDASGTGAATYTWTEGTVTNATTLQDVQLSNSFVQPELVPGHSLGEDKELIDLFFTAL